jgi:hypothetical protein
MAHHRAKPYHPRIILFSIMSIDRARAQQQQQQAKTILKSRQSSPAIVASAPTRDPVDGSYTLATGNGGIVRQGYISSSKPDVIPAVVVPSTTIGLPGYFTQRPS